MRFVREPRKANRPPQTYHHPEFFIYIHCLCMCSSVIHWCQTLYKPMDCSLPGFSVHGLSQARILEWVAISFSRGSSWPRDQTRFSCFSCTGRWVLYHCTTYCLPILNSLTFGWLFGGWFLPCPKWSLMALTCSGWKQGQRLRSGPDGESTGILTTN